jgi:hypothetical protein
VGLAFEHVYGSTTDSAPLPASELLERLARQPPWMRDALCREPHEAEFFPPERNPGHGGEGRVPAVPGDRGVPGVRPDRRQPRRVWGGTTLGERSAMRTEKRLAGWPAEELRRGRVIDI